MIPLPAVLDIDTFTVAGNSGEWQLDLADHDPPADDVAPRRVAPRILPGFIDVHFERGAGVVMREIPYDRVADRRQIGGPSRGATERHRRQQIVLSEAKSIDDDRLPRRVRAGH